MACLGGILLNTQSTTAKSSGKRNLFIFTLLLGTFSMSISQSSLSTAYPTLMRTFNVTADTVQWLTTGFMLVMSILIPVSPWLLHNIPFKRLFQGIIAIFFIGTLFCILAPNFPMLLIGRILEAIAVGIIFPSYQTVLLTITPKKQRGGTMGLAGLVMGSALAVGPIISGVLLQFFSWQGLFILFLIMMVITFVLSLGAIKDVMTLEKSSIDGLSVVLAAGFPGVLWVLTEFVHGGFHSWLAWVILVASIIGMVWFVGRQLRASKPLLQLKVFASKIYTMSVFLTGISYIALIVTTIIMPLYFQQVLHISPLMSGLSLVPAAVVLSLLNPISGRLLDKVGGTFVIRIGMCLIIVGMGLMALFANAQLLGIAILAAIITESGNAFVMMPAVTWGANALTKDLLADATAVTTTVRQILGSLGVMVATEILTVVTQLHQATAGAAGAQLLGFRVTFIVFMLVGVLGLLLTLTMGHLSKTQA
ncbi:putative multidrug transport protein (putative) [Agrilactobacillus composti DSM 18527 = JCM 14202]|uniref:Putative multidrug transport protein (Putative) n=1 Tax=Agrilactobacillus composti DSM 18527 = JCM 14202 TaxID=1423734 RepID=A0A0R1XLB6_9LACO|nr:putative multidrug transport protein (putative) [Agrilactobacillus composti DSM 18527 = JCM 14202]